MQVGPTDVCCEGQANVRRILNRFTLQDLNDVFPNFINIQPVDEQYVKQDKKSFVEWLDTNHFKHKIRFQDMAIMDVYYSSKSAVGKKWTVWEISHKSDGGSSVRVDPELIRLEFQKLVGSFIHHFTSTHVMDGSIWIRTHIIRGRFTKKKAPSAADVITIAYSPRASSLLITSMSASDRDMVIPSLCTALGIHSLKEKPLTGPHIASLQKIIFCEKRVLQRSSGLHSEDRAGDDLSIHGHSENQSLVSTLGRKRKWAHAVDIFDEQLPVLSKLTFDITSSFAQKSKIALDQPVHMKVSFDGQSVLEGLQQLEKNGLADLSRMDFIAEIAVKATNHFVIQDGAFVDKRS